MQTIPTWLQVAFSDWVTRQLYLDGGGNYRSHASHRIVAYNRQLKKIYPENQQFHDAAHLWLELWEAVPTGRINDTRPEKGPGSLS
jgi:hypothetical protein